MSVSSLIDELWELSPPRSAMTTLQTYVLQLRKKIAVALGVTTGEVVDDILVTVNSGYQLNIHDAYLDLREYREMERLGSEALRAGDDSAASEAFGRALALWRGPALTDIERGRLLEAQAAGLEQSRLTILERRTEAQLRLNRHRELLDELAAHVVEQPFHENLHGNYMIALYRSGRRIEALEAYSQLRRSMVDELGLEPSPQLQAVQRAVLAAEPCLHSTETVAVGVGARAAAPPGGNATRS